MADDGFGAGEACQGSVFLPYRELSRHWQHNLLTTLVIAEVIPPGLAARSATWHAKGFITHSDTKDRRRDPDLMAQLLVSIAPLGGRGAQRVSTRR